MKTTYQWIACIAILLFVTPLTTNAQLKNSKTESLKVSGNCGMCKKTIETAANDKNISLAEWNKDTEVLTLTYDSVKTNSDAVLKKLAYAGYDNEKYLAPDEAYENLPGCCQYERSQKAEALAVNSSNEGMKAEMKQEMKHDMHQDMKHDMKEEKTKDKEKSETLEPVFKSYFLLKDALTQDDGVTGAAEAKNLFKAIDAVDMSGLSSEEHTVWMKLVKKLSYDAEHIKGVTDTEHQREHFVTLSSNMFELMKVSKSDVAVYYQHCPMANEGKGANWLSLEEKINNPYMGKKMPTCGKTVETIK